MKTNKRFLALCLALLIACAGPTWILLAAQAFFPS